MAKRSTANSAGAPRAPRAPRAPVAVVSGVTGDLGPAVVRAFWRRGVAVFGFYGRSRNRANALQSEAGRDGHALRLASVDLKAADRAGTRIRAAIASSPAVWRRADVFVGLAGLSARGVWRKKFEDTRSKFFEDVYRIDSLSHIAFAQTLAPALKKSKGSIVLMSSAAGLTGDDLGIPFAMAKAANVALVKSLARIYAPQVRVNGMAPGALETAWLKELSASQKRDAKKKALLERFGKPEEIAEAIVELALGRNQFMTGQILVLDGGVVL